MEIHRPPLIKFAINYFRQKYGTDPTKWDKETIKFAVNLLGIQAHRIQDLVWHSSEEISKKK
jgi:hypothetical protein